MADESYDLAVVVGILLCLFIVADGDAAANLYTGTATLDNNIRAPGLNCVNNNIPSSNIIATVSAPIYTVDMCGATYIIQCDSDASTDPSYKDPCINVNNNEVTVTIVGQCDADAGEDCTSFIQLSADAYSAIVADPSISTLLRINYGPTTNTASASASASASVA